MENKAKFLIIGLIGFLLLSVIVSLQTYNTKLSLQREKDRLVSENQQLTQQAEENRQRAKGLEDRASLLNEELRRLNREKEEFQKKFDLLNSEKALLMERLQSQKQAPAAEEEASPQGFQALTAPGAGDSYWAGILKAKTDLELQVTGLRSELKTAQINNDQLQREKSAMQLDLNAFKREKEDLQRQVEYNKKILDGIAQDLVREKNDKIKIQESIKTLKNENEVLMRQLKSLNTRKFDLEKKVQELQEAKVDIERRFQEMENRVAAKLSMVNEIKEGLEGVQGQGSGSGQRKESVELAPIVVRPQGGQQEPEVRVQGETRVLGGKVLAINRDSNFVIIDLGEEAGVKLGDTLKVYRVDKSIAALEVIQTRKNIAACDIKSEIVPVKIGDAVR